ncbi:MAG: hypothetical protein VW268_14050 [Rhodospirillaceae bacterium]
MALQAARMGDSIAMFDMRQYYRDGFGVTFFGLVFTPMFYVVCRVADDRLRRLIRMDGAGS